MSRVEDNYWVPPVEDFFYNDEEELRLSFQSIVRSAETLIDYWKEDDYDWKLEEGMLDYLESRNLDGTFEFVIHPSHWMNEFDDPFEYYSDIEPDYDFQSSHWNYQAYSQDLESGLIDAQRGKRPIFVFHSKPEPLNPWPEATDNFVQNELGLPAESYYKIPTIPSNGYIADDRGFEEFLSILECSTDFEARVSGELRGRCPAQFETFLSILTESTPFFDFDIVQGPKFPLRPFKPDSSIAGHDEMYTDQARAEFDAVLVKEIQRDIVEEEPVPGRPIKLIELGKRTEFYADKE